MNIGSGGSTASVRDSDMMNILTAWQIKGPNEERGMCLRTVQSAAMSEAVGRKMDLQAAKEKYWQVRAS